MSHFVAALAWYNWKLRQQGTEIRHDNITPGHLIRQVTHIVAAGFVAMTIFFELILVLDTRSATNVQEILVRSGCAQLPDMSLHQKFFPPNNNLTSGMKPS